MTNERAFWIKALEHGEIADGDLDHAIGLMTKHRALEDTINRAQHYGAMAVDALALFPASPMKSRASNRWWHSVWHGRIERFCTDQLCKVRRQEDRRTAGGPSDAS